MPSWLAVTLLVVVVSLLWFCILCGVVISCSRRLYVARVKEQIATKRMEQMQQLLDTYGIKEITIGGDE